MSRPRVKTTGRVVVAATLCLAVATVVAAGVAARKPVLIWWYTRALVYPPDFQDMATADRRRTQHAATELLRLGEEARQRALNWYASLLTFPFTGQMENFASLLPFQFSGQMENFRPLDLVDLLVLCARLPPGSTPDSPDTIFLMGIEDYVRAEDLPVLFDLLDSEETCFSVDSPESSAHTPGLSTVGNEVAHLIWGFRSGRYPGLHSWYSQAEKDELRRWWRERPRVLPE